MNQHKHSWLEGWRRSRSSAPASMLPLAGAARGGRGGSLWPMAAASNREGKEVPPGTRVAPVNGFHVLWFPPVQMALINLHLNGLFLVMFSRH